MKTVWIGFAVASFMVFAAAFLATMLASSGAGGFLLISGVAVTNMILSLKEVVK